MGADRSGICHAKVIFLPGLKVPGPPVSRFSYFCPSPLIFSQKAQMVSPLWKASSDGDLDAVLAILNNEQVDLELKDHTGATALIEAVKNGHLEVVRALLSKGADPNNASSQGRPEQFTSDPAIVELLRSFQSPPPPEVVHNNIYANDDPAKGYYAPPPPPGPYGYYPPMHPVMSPMGDGPVYYPQQPQQHSDLHVNAGGAGHLPPPDVARMIPCRYFPACRYGAQCMFAHPQGPFAPPPPPPGQYPPFDPSLGSPYGYYPPPPPPQPYQNGAPMSPLSPQPMPPHPMHGRSPSEIVSPTFPNGGPPPPPLGPYGPMPPTNYPHPGPVPVPMSVPPLPPMHHQPPPPSGPAPQSPSAMYNNAPIPFPGPDGQYYPPPPPPMAYPEMDGKVATPTGMNGQAEGFIPHHHPHPNGIRRGVPRRNSFKAHKTPCAFFPSGRCKNGDDCRWPHVASENLGPNHAPHHFFAPRGGVPRLPRGPGHVNGIAAINQKMGNMTVRDDAPCPQNGTNGATEDSSRPQPTDPVPRPPKFHQGPHKHHHHHPNGVNGKRFPGAAPIRPQRVPSADDFPVLPGSVTPPKQNGAANGHSGPTAAQILSAPAPARKENGKDSSTSGSVRGPSPVPTQEEPKFEDVKPTVAPEQVQVPIAAPAPAPASQKLPLSFAAAATVKAAAAVAISAPETPKEVSVSA
ncbi:hypothetical protein D9611_005720 [Ephemerocybe angulata]|uniref:C3H1-type domain-containing protein n=1 Tax=Ephemerocybe angulata TaxID=980116 RepID=A0A8H5BJS3_9AGAR|nr:hypothetical protein D9611_005720 [Tulosesus angulatus]